MPKFKKAFKTLESHFVSFEKCINCVITTKIKLKACNHPKNILKLILGFPNDYSDAYKFQILIHYFSSENTPTFTYIWEIIW